MLWAVKRRLQKIVKNKVDYILSVKDNQRELYEDIQDSFRVLSEADFYENLDYGHWRIETRKCTMLTDLSLVENVLKWESLNSIVKVERERYLKVTEKKETQLSFYIISLH